MVKNKREIITPRKRNCLTRKQKILDRTITKVLSRPNSGASSIKERASTANIKVVVRVRPPNHKETGDNCRNVVKVVEDNMLIFDPEEETQAFFFHGIQQKGRDLLKKARKNMKFYFDKIYREECTNNEIFEGTTHSLIDRVMSGYNCSVFAYGATGAGKTFTMTGTSEKPGITFLTMTELFKKQQELANERDFEIGITYLEVYNELVKDLLNPGPPLNLREDSNYGVIVAGIKFYKISNAFELFSLLEQGNINRTQHPTDANAESSRSHAVFQVYLKMTVKLSKEVRTAKLSMIDLAGSERGSATGCAGARFTEGANINKSLLALGNCINSLADGHRHVPYRDSKLTRLLKDSLGGNCHTVMIANVSPSSMSFDDTYNTLKYATRANSIKASIHRNVTKADLNVMQYVKMVEDLEKDNLTVKEELKTERTKNALLEKECERLKQELASSACLASRSVCLGQIEQTLTNEIKALAQQKRDLLERRFQMERNETTIALRKLEKEEVDNRLSDICLSTPEKVEARDKINSTLMRFKKQEQVFRDTIENAEDVTDEIDKKLDMLEIQNPQYQDLILTEKLKLDVRRAEHKILLEQKHCELLSEENEEKAEIIEKMGSTLRNCFKLLQGHGYATPTIAKQYKDVVQALHGRKNIKWTEMPDSGVSSLSSNQDEDERKALVKRKLESPPRMNRTFSASTSSLLEIDTNKPKMKICNDPLISSGSKQVVALPMAKKFNSKSPRIGIRLQLSNKSPRNKENIVSIARKPFEPAKSAQTGKSMVNQYGTKGMKPRPIALLDRPRFKR